MSKATGAGLFKRFSKVITPVVRKIITASIKECKHPNHIITLYLVPKFYPPYDINNDFRPIQLQFNQKNFRLHSSQHGFANGHSTVSALVSIAQPWFNATDNTCC